MSTCTRTTGRARTCTPHGHAHLHGHGSDPGLLATFGWFQLLRPLAVGLVHGLAGSAAVALLVLAPSTTPASQCSTS